jgi:integrase
VRHELKLLRQALKAYAVREDETREQLAAYVQLHPIMTVKLPEPSAPRTRRINDEEFKKVLRKIKCAKKRAAVLLGLYTTLRRAEILSLRAEDIRWDLKTVLLRARTVPDPERPGGVRQVRKSKTTEREVPLIPEALELLERLAPKGTSGRIFDFADGSLTQAFGRAAEAAVVINARVHDVRRESVSWLYEEHKLTLVELTLFTGHGDVATLQKHYLQPNPARLAAQLANKIGQRDLVIQ